MKLDPNPRCPFCERPIPQIEGNYLEADTLRCDCGAEYWPDSPGDWFVSPAECYASRGWTADNLEVAIVRDYDRLLDYPEQSLEEGDEVVLVFVRPKCGDKIFANSPPTESDKE